MQCLSVSFNRPNIVFAVRPKVGGQKGLAAFAAFVARTHAGQSGIVYCREFPALCMSPFLPARSHAARCALHSVS